MAKTLTNDKDFARLLKLVKKSYEIQVGTHPFTVHVPMKVDIEIYSFNERAEVSVDWTDSVLAEAEAEEMVENLPEVLKLVDKLEATEKEILALSQKLEEKYEEKEDYLAEEIREEAQSIVETVVRNRSGCKRMKNKYPGVFGK